MPSVRLLINPRGYLKVHNIPGCEGHHHDPREWRASSGLRCTKKEWWNSRDDGCRWWVSRDLRVQHVDWSCPGTYPLHVVTFIKSCREAHFGTSSDWKQELVIEVQFGDVADFFSVKLELW